MNAMTPHRGGAAVGHLQDYDGITAAAIIYLRMWCDGPDTQASVITDMTNTLGPARGRRAMEALGELCSICARHGRRPLTRHALQCSCVGADEASFAHFVATAADGDRDDAMLMAILLVRPDMAPIATGLAAQFGLALKQMNLAAPRVIARTPTYQPTFH